MISEKLLTKYPMEICHTGKCWLERSNAKLTFTFWSKSLKCTNLENLLSQPHPKPGCPYALSYKQPLVILREDT